MKKRAFFPLLICLGCCLVGIACRDKEAPNWTDSFTSSNSECSEDSPTSEISSSCSQDFHDSTTNNESANSSTEGVESADDSDEQSGEQSGEDLPNPTPHQHSYGSWIYDTQEHYRICSCGEKNDQGAHFLDENQICTLCKIDLSDKILAYALAENAPYYEVRGFHEGATETEVYIHATYRGQPVKGIACAAFSEQELSSIALPNSITYIAESAFAFSSLARIEMGEGVIEIRERAFYGCENLTEIVIPASVQRIEKNAFAGCTSLKKITFNNPNGWSIFEEEYGADDVEIEALPPLSSEEEISDRLCGRVTNSMNETENLTQYILIRKEDLP